MPLNVLGNEVSVMRIGKRQLALRGYRKKNKPLVVFKRKSVPTETPYILQAQLCLARSAIEMRGHTLEEVVANVINNCAGKQYKPDSVREQEKRMRYQQADAHVREMERKLASVREYPTTY